MLAGALGAISASIIFSLNAAVLPPKMMGAVQGPGSLMRLICLPTILAGAVCGALLVWLLVAYGKPAWLFRRLAQSADNRRLYLIAFAAGFICGPVLALLFVFITLYDQ